MAIQAPLSPAQGETIKRFYRGLSMTRVFVPGDLLYIETVPVVEMKPGDIVAYGDAKSDPDAADTVHRIIAITPQGLICRGDNNQYPDRIPVTQQRLIGRVIGFERGGRRRAVRSGPAGMRRARLNWAKSSLARILTSPVRPLYLWVRKSGLAGFVWKPLIRRVHFCSPGGEYVKYVWHGRTVAVRHPGSRTNTIRKPYDLILWKEVGGDAGSAVDGHGRLKR